MGQRSRLLSSRHSPFSSTNASRNEVNGPDPDGDGRLLGLIAFLENVARKRGVRTDAASVAIARPMERADIPRAKEVPRVASYELVEVIDEDDPWQGLPGRASCHARAERTRILLRPRRRRRRA